MNVPERRFLTLTHLLPHAGSIVSFYSGADGAWEIKHDSSTSDQELEGGRAKWVELLVSTAEASPRGLWKGSGLLYLQTEFGFAGGSSVTPSISRRPAEEGWWADVWLLGQSWRFVC